MSRSASLPPTVPPKPGAISPARALELIVAAAAPLPAELVAVADASGRTLARDAAAVLAMPLETNSAMDGFAVAAAEGPWQAAPIAGESRAGTPFTGERAPGAVVRIATGAPLPPGTDSVVPLELATEAAGSVTLPAAQAGRHVRHAGEDLAPGDVIAAAGTCLAPHQLVALAGAGVAELSCHRAARVAIVVTGDEVVAPGTVPAPGQVVDVHGIALPPLLRSSGAQVSAVVHVRDDRAALVQALAALPAVDVVVLTGGVSVGRHDHTRAALEELDVELLVPRLLMRPGQPTAVGRTGDGRLWFGLPGNPVSAYVVATLLALPALRRLGGATADQALPARLPLAAPVTPDPRRWLALRATVTGDPRGRQAVVLEAQASHMTAALAHSTALAMLPPGDAPLPAGTPVGVVTLPGAAW